jgi:hypothetical protein
MTAAEVASRFGPESGVQLVLPRQPGLVRRAELIAQETGVDVKILKITEGAVHLRFVARQSQRLAEDIPAARRSHLTKALTGLATGLQIPIRHWREAARAVLTHRQKALDGHAHGSSVSS